MFEKTTWPGAVTLLLLLLCTACSKEPQGAEHLLARVHNRTLYLSELEGMFPPDATQEDSTLIIQAYVNRWVRENILLHEAERNIPPDLNIDRLVRDYRASLVRANYERVLVTQLLDSIVSKQELTEFYEANKDQYQLETPIIRCYFIKVPVPTPQAERLRQLWNSGQVKDMAALRDYCKKYASVSLLNDSAWFSVNEIARQLPEGTLTPENVGAKREFTQKDDSNQFYFRLFEMKNRREIAPLSYIEDQARKAILHRRKAELLEEVKEDMYESELRRNNIEIFYH